MKCMRCGVEISSDSVFCDACLADMERHPIAPGTPINLPRREKQQPIKRVKKRIYKPDEVISSLRRTIGWLLSMVLILAIALTIAIYLLVTQPNDGLNNPIPGQNYGTSANQS